MIDLSTWLNTEQVCARLGLSPRTLEREMRKGLWESRLRQRPGKRPERVYSEQAVAAREPKPPTELMAPTVPTMQRVVAGSPPDIFMETFARLAAAALPPAPPPPVTLFCTLPEASAITGLSVPFLKRLITAGGLPAVKDRAIKVRREDLQAISARDGAARKARA